MPLPGRHLKSATWRRIELAMWAALVIICFVLVHLAENRANNAERQSGEAITRVTKIESPCAKYGADDVRCERAFEVAVASLNKREACFIWQKSGAKHAVGEAFSRAAIYYVEPCAGVRLREAPVPMPPARRKQRERHRDSSTSVDAPASSQPQAATAPSQTGSGQGEASPTHPGAPSPSPPTHHEGSPGTPPAPSQGGSPGSPTSPSPSTPTAAAPSPAPSPGSPQAPSQPAPSNPVASNPPIVEAHVGSEVTATVGGESVVEATAPAPLQVCVPPLVTVNCR